MQATIDTIFVKYSFCPFSLWNMRQMHFKRGIVTKTGHPPHPPKIPHWRPLHWVYRRWGEGAAGIGIIQGGLRLVGGGGLKELYNSVSIVWTNRKIKIQSSKLETPSLVTCVKH